MSVWLQTITGRAVDFDAPQIERVHLFTEVGPSLARIARFNGHTDLPYFVAQHSVLIAEAALDETGDPELAAFALLHDGHEFALGDRTSPAKAAEYGEIVRIAEARGARKLLAGAEAAMRARHALESRFDRAIFAAAGLDPDRHALHADAIRLLDQRALLAERRDLMRKAPRPWDVDTMGLAPLPLRKGRIKPWVWPEAAERFCEALQTLCPAPAFSRESAAGAARHS